MLLEIPRALVAVEKINILSIIKLPIRRVNFEGVHIHHKSQSNKKIFPSHREIACIQKYKMFYSFPQKYLITPLCLYCSPRP